jgi:hypothetical protein
VHWVQTFWPTSASLFVEVLFHSATSDTLSAQPCSALVSRTPALDKWEVVSVLEIIRDLRRPCSALQADTPRARGKDLSREKPVDLLNTFV